MRVIDELIRYLWRTRQLSADDMTWLSNNGYCDDFDLYYGDYDNWVRYADDQDDDAGEEADDDAFEDRKPRRRSGPSVGGKALVDDLVMRLAARREEAADVLQEFTRFCPEGADAEAAADLVNRLAHAGPDEAVRAVAQVLSGAEDGLSAVTRIIACNYVHIELEGRVGPAVRAYQKLIAARDISAVGKYGWILREPEIAAAYAMVRAQARLADALGRLLDEDDKVLACAIVPFEPAAFWFLCLLLTAKRAGEGDAWAPGIIAPRPHRLPAFEDLYRLMDLALGATSGGKKQAVLNDDFHPVTALLLSRFQNGRAGATPDAGREAMKGLVAFDVWDRTYRPPEVFDDWKSTGENHE